MGNETSHTASQVVHQIQSNVEEKWDQFQTVITEQKNSINGANGSLESNEHSHDGTDNEQGGSFEVENEIEHEVEDAPQLSEKHIQAVKASWGILRHRLKHIGVLTFLHLFDHHPNAQHTFKSFATMPTEDLHGNEIFHNHANRVMKVIEKVVHNIDEPTVYIKYLTMLGQKHVMYEAEPQYLNQMGFMFLSAIQPLLEKENAWNEEVRDGWEQLFLVVIFTMKAAMEREQRLALKLNH